MQKQAITFFIFPILRAPRQLPARSSDSKLWEDRNCLDHPETAYRIHARLRTQVAQQVYTPAAGQAAAGVLLDVRGRAYGNTAEGAFHRAIAKGGKKEEFPGFTSKNMLPGNSFPQICVVSVNEYVENFRFAKQHRGIVA